jgi:hypothetical protein
MFCSVLLSATSFFAFIIRIIVQPVSTLSPTTDHKHFFNYSRPVASQWSPGRQISSDFIDPHWFQILSDTEVEHDQIFPPAVVIRASGGQKPDNRNLPTRRLPSSWELAAAAGSQVPVRVLTLTESLALAQVQALADSMAQIRSPTLSETQGSSYGTSTSTNTGTGGGKSPRGQPD